MTRGHKVQCTRLTMRLVLSDTFLEAEHTKIKV